MEFPENLKYTEDHEWVRFEEDGIAYIGITDYAQSELGDIVFVDVEKDGETVEAGDVFGTVEAVKTVSDLFMPITGEIVEVNASLEDDPEQVNKDPYGKGWMIKVKVAEDASHDKLMEAGAYEASLG